MLLLTSDEPASSGLRESVPSGLELYERDEGHGALAVTGDESFAPKGFERHRIKVLFTGGRYGPSAGSYLFHVALWTPDDYRTEFLAWYEVEHLPMLLEASGWDGCRFVEEDVDKGFLFHALHQLSDRKALDSEQRKHSRATPWFRRLSANPWFDVGFKRSLYRRI